MDRDGRLGVADAAEELAKAGTPSSPWPRLIYSAITSLDGYVADQDGPFDWAAPDEEVHTFVNDLERSVGTYLYGRRMYEVMRGWEAAPAVAGQPPVVPSWWEAASHPSPTTSA